MPESLDLVCANLPYVDRAASLADEVKAQPASALYARDGGAALVVRLLNEAPAHLVRGGRLLAEIDPAILEAVMQAARKSFAETRIHRDLGGHERVIEAWSFIPTNSEASP
jgi:release factor glutamine methyltransferase